MIAPRSFTAANIAAETDHADSRNYLRCLVGSLGSAAAEPVDPIPQLQRDWMRTDSGCRSLEKGGAAGYLSEPLGPNRPEHH